MSTRERVVLSDDALASRRARRGARQRDPRPSRQSGEGGHEDVRRIRADVRLEQRPRLSSSHARLADPDSDERFGQEFRVDSLSVDEYEPTFKFRNVRAERAPPRRFGLVSRCRTSTCRRRPGMGMARCGGEATIPMRYDIAIRGDSVSLERRELGVSDAAAHGRRHARPLHQERSEESADRRLQAREHGRAQHGSHLTGDMTFGTGAPLLARAERGSPRRPGRLRPAAHAQRQALPRGLAGAD